MFRPQRQLSRRGSAPAIVTGLTKQHSRPALFRGRSGRCSSPTIPQNGAAVGIAPAPTSPSRRADGVEVVPQGRSLRRMSTLGNIRTSKKKRSLVSERCA